MLYIYIFRQQLFVVHLLQVRLNVGALHLKITERSTNDRLLYENTFQSGAANLTGTGTSLHIFQQDVVETILVRKGNPIDILVELVTVTTGTNTRQEGYVTP